MGLGAAQDDAPVEYLSTREGYDRWAAIYDDEDNPLVAMESPRILEQIGKVSQGMRIADVGCGTGRHALALARRGARVVAIDFSLQMLARARRKEDAWRVHWVVHDVNCPLPLRDGSFDKVLCCLVLDHVRDLQGLFGQLRRVCRSDGRVIVSTLHPAMLLRGVQARFRDPETACEVRPESVPNQISDYVIAALRAGLMIKHMSEHAVDDELAARSERAAPYRGWPMLLLMTLEPRQAGHGHDRF